MALSNVESESDVVHLERGGGVGGGGGGGGGGTYWNFLLDVP